WPSTPGTSSIILKCLSVTDDSPNFLPHGEPTTGRTSPWWCPYPRTGLKPGASPLTSVVAGDAVERGPRAVRGILLAVAGHAPSHRERARRRLETNELLQVVGERRPGFGPDHPHALDRAVARLAREAEPHVGLVSEVGELGEFEDPDPRDRLPATRVLVDLGDLGIVQRADDLVASQAAFHRRKARVLGAPGVSMAVLAVHPVLAGVDEVAEEDRLRGRSGRRHDRDHGRGAERWRRERAHVEDHLADLRVAQVFAERGHARREPLDRPATPDDVGEEVVGQPIHEAAVGEVRGLGGETGGRGAVAPPRRAVTECALRGIERLARLEIEGRRRRAGPGGRSQPDEDRDEKDRDTETGAERAP